MNHAPLTSFKLRLRLLSLLTLALLTLFVCACYQNKSIEFITDISPFLTQPYEKDDFWVSPFTDTEIFTQNLDLSLGDGDTSLQEWDNDFLPVIIDPVALKKHLYIALPASIFLSAWYLLFVLCSYSLIQHLRPYGFKMNSFLGAIGWSIPIYNLYWCYQFSYRIPASFAKKTIFPPWLQFLSFFCLPIISLFPNLVITTLVAFIYWQYFSFLDSDVLSESNSNSLA